jgi:rRNA maturation protein Nop10
MFHCERCGSRYNAAYAVAIETCPRCQARDGTEVPLTFSPFRRFEIEPRQRIASAGGAAVSSSQQADSLRGMIAAR